MLRPRRRARLRPRSRAVRAALLLLASVSGLVGLAAPPAAAQTPHLRVVLDSVTPVATDPDGTVQATGRVLNTGDVPLSEVNAAFWVDEEPLTSRRQLASAAGERPGERLGERITWPEDLLDGVARTLRPGASAPFELAIPVERLQLTGTGVYVVGVDVRGTTPDDATRETWRVRTFLPWIPDEERLTPVEVAFVVPLVGAPNLVTSDTVLDDDGARAFAPDGRLRRLLELGSEHDLSFVVDPALLTEAQAMSDGYQTWRATDDDDTATGAANARRWLDRARGVLAAHDAHMLPYADPDLPALERHRMTERFGQGVRAADEAAQKYETSPGSIVWPGEGYADAGLLETIAAAGGRSVLLSGKALPDLPSDGSSPVVSLVTPEGTLTGLVADPALTGGGPGPDGSPLQMQQRFLSETSLLAAASGQATDLRRVVAALPRGWNPGASGGGLFDIVESTPWLRSISAGALLSAPPVAYGGRLDDPASAQRRDLGPRVVESLRELSTTSDTLLDVLAEPEDSRTAIDNGFLRGASTAWRADPDRGVNLIDAMEIEHRATTYEVSVVPPRLVTLSSSSGRFPVTVSNEGSRPVRVQLDVRPRDPGLLEVEPIEPVRVDPNRRATVSVDARAVSGGVSQVDVRLLTTTGTAFGASASFPVRATDYGQVGWVIIGIGLGLLMLAAVFRIVRRARAALSTRPKSPDAEPEKPREPTRT